MLLDRHVVSPVRWESCAQPSPRRGRHVRRGRPRRRAHEARQAGRCPGPERGRGGIWAASRPRRALSTQEAEPGEARPPAGDILGRGSGYPSRRDREPRTRRPSPAWARSCPTAGRPNTCFEIVGRHERRVDPGAHRASESGTSPPTDRSRPTSRSRPRRRALEAAAHRRRSRSTSSSARRSPVTRRSPRPPSGSSASSASTCPAFDVNAACAGFSYAMSTATAFVESGQRRHRAGDRRRGALPRPGLHRPRRPASCSATARARWCCGRRRAGRDRLGARRRRPCGRDPDHPGRRFALDRRRTRPSTRATTRSACRTGARSSSARSSRCRTPAASCWRSPASRPTTSTCSSPTRRTPGS